MRLVCAIMIRKMSLPLYLTLALAAANSDYDRPTPVYTVLPDGERVEIMFDIKSYLIAALFGIPMFILIMGTQVYLRHKYELYLEKQKKPVRRNLSNVHMALYSVDTPSSPKRHRLYEP